MGKIIKQVNQLPTKVVILINMMVLILVAGLLSIWLVQQQTHPDSRASSGPVPVEKKDKLSSPTPVAVTIPEVKPEIEKVVKPYGKVGDAVVIKGFNFGSGPPPNSGVWFGDVQVGRNNIQEWSDKRIVVAVPNIKIPQPVEVLVNGQAVVWNGPFTIYDEYTNTSLELRKNLDGRASLSLEAPPEGASLQLKIRLAGTGVENKIIKPAGGWRVQTGKIAAGEKNLTITSRVGRVAQVSDLVSWPMSEGEVVNLEYASIYDMNTGKFVRFWIEPGKESLVF